MYNEPAAVHLTNLMVCAYWLYRYCTAEEQTSLGWGIELQVVC